MGVSTSARQHGGDGLADQSSERPSTTSSCPDAETVLAFVQGALAGEERARTEEHAASCDACRGLLSDLARAQSGERSLDPISGDTVLAHTEIAESQPSNAQAASARASSTSRPPLAALPGDMIAGKYAVTSVLGAGGMGYVVAARHVSLRRDVAIKFLLPEIAERAEVVVRFLREARAAAKLESDHVVRVLDVDVLPTGAPYIVMEHLQGTDLATRLAKLGKLSVSEAVQVVVEACDALHEAHKKGLIHRDLKPANLFLVERGDGRLVTKVLDFGIAKSLGGDSEQASTGATDKSPMVLGTPRYMSPEQARAGNVDARSDVWALGAVLYELLSGRPSFEGTTVIELLAKIATEPPPPLAVKGVPAGLERAIFRCLKKPVDERFSSVAELALAIAPFGPPEARVIAARLNGSTKAAGLGLATWKLALAGVSLVVVGALIFKAFLSTPAPVVVADEARTSAPSAVSTVLVTAQVTPTAPLATSAPSPTSAPSTSATSTSTSSAAAAKVRPKALGTARTETTTAAAPPPPPPAPTAVPSDPHGLSDRH